MHLGTSSQIPTTKFLIEERLVETFIDGDLAFKSPKAPRTELCIILANFN